MSGTFNVRNPEVEAKLRELAARIHGELPDSFGFTLFLFEYSETPGGQLFYISSAERPDMVRVVKEWLARQTQ